MKRLSIFTLSALIIILSGISIFFSSTLMAAEYVAGEILVKFKASARAAEIENLHSYAGAARKKHFKRMRVQQVSLSESMSVEDAVNLYRKDPNVEYAEPNYIVHADAFSNDPSFTELWGLHNISQSVNGSAGTSDADIDAPEAWELTTGSTDVVIAVVDSGVAYSHPDFYDPVDPANNNIWLNAAEDDFQGHCSDGIDDNSNGFIDDCAECADGADDDGNGYIDDCRGWDFIGDDNDPNDYHDGVGHGTHVAGTIAAFGNNGTAITGVMWRSKLMPLRFLGIEGTGNIADAVSAIEYANNKGAHVINNSWGGGPFSQTLHDAITASTAIVVCASGNYGMDNDTAPHYPASYDSPNIIAVAATDQNDILADFSNTGPTTVDIAAPGRNIYSSVPEYVYGAEETLYPAGGGVEDFDSQTGIIPTGGDLLGWRSGGSNQTWEITTGTGAGSTNSLEDSPAANYENNTNSFAGYTTEIPSVKDNIFTLSFQWKGSLETDIDFLDIVYSPDFSVWYLINDNSKDRLLNITGSSSGNFTNFSTLKFTEIAEMYDGFYFGIRLYSDESVTEDGIYIDDFTVTRKPVVINSYTYGHLAGTSMAAPHVSGVAGLIKSMDAGLTNQEIKDVILKSVDAKSSLTGKVLTGGRLNAQKALEYALAPYAPTELTVISVSDTQITLSWKDNSAREEGYQIDRKTGPDGAFSEINRVSPDISSYTDTGLEPATSYSYRLRPYGETLGDYAYSTEVVTGTAPSVSSSNGGGGGGGGGCFIATAAYGSIMHPYVKELRKFRDTYLLTNYMGKVFVDLYYEYSPPIANVISRSEHLRAVTRIMLSPLVLSVVFPFESAGLLIGGICISAVLLKRRSTSLP
jgi:subtilisin family serine protease